MTSGTSYSELEIGIHRRHIDTYSVELRFGQPSDESDSDAIRVEPCRAKIDLTALTHLSDPGAYGEKLTAGLFGDERVSKAFDVNYRSALERKTPLRLRLFVGPSAPELHAVRWETLQFPPGSAGGGLLSTSEHIYFSRFLSSAGHLSADDWRRVRLRPRSKLTALVVIANPWSDINIEEEQARAE